MKKENKIKPEVKRLMDLFQISEIQAKDINNRYLKDVKIDEFIDFYFEFLANENPVGTTYEKLNIAGKKAGVELVARYENKEIFLTWLCNKYKNQAVFRVFSGDFEYSYYANYGSDEKIQITQKAEDVLICVNAYKQISYANGEPLENNMFKEALLEFMFQNQSKIAKNINLALPSIKTKRVLSLEEARALEKKRENELYGKNKDKFELLLKNKMVLNIS